MNESDRALMIPNQAGPLSLEQMVQLGTLLARSGFFSDAKDAAQAVAKILAGAEAGFPPMASMTGIYIVKGRVTFSANMMAAAVKRSRSYDYKVKQLDENGCTLEFFRGDGQLLGTSTFGTTDAKKANLNGDNWQHFPRNMFFARAMSNGVKWFCPDVFGGAAIYTPDELDDKVRLDDEGEPVIATLPKTEISTVEPPPPSKPAEAQVNIPAAYWTRWDTLVTSARQLGVYDAFGKEHSLPFESREDDNGPYQCCVDRPPFSNPGALTEMGKALGEIIKINIERKGLIAQAWQPLFDRARELGIDQLPVLSPSDPLSKQEERLESLEAIVTAAEAGQEAMTI